MPHCHTLIAALRRSGYRLTPQREMIVEAIAHAGRHITAEEIFEQVRSRTGAVNIATIYRTLDLLVELGLVSCTDLGDGKIWYASSHHGPHCHLVCRYCGCVTEADYALLIPIDERLREQYGFVADLHHLAIPGVCAACQSKTNPR